MKPGDRIGGDCENARGPSRPGPYGRTACGVVPDSAAWRGLDDVRRLPWAPQWGIADRRPYMQEGGAPACGRSPASTDGDTAHCLSAREERKPACTPLPAPDSRCTAAPASPPSAGTRPLRRARRPICPPPPCHRPTCHRPPCRRAPCRHPACRRPAAGLSFTWFPARPFARSRHSPGTGATPTGS